MIPGEASKRSHQGELSSHDNHASYNMTRKSREMLMVVCLQKEAKRNVVDSHNEALLVLGPSRVSGGNKGKIKVKGKGGGFIVC